MNFLLCCLEIMDFLHKINAKITIAKVINAEVSIKKMYEGCKFQLGTSEFSLGL